MNTFQQINYVVLEVVSTNQCGYIVDSASAVTVALLGLLQPALGYLNYLTTHPHTHNTYTPHPHNTYTPTHTDSEDSLHFDDLANTADRDSNGDGASNGMELCDQGDLDTEGERGCSMVARHAGRLE